MCLSPTPEGAHPRPALNPLVGWSLMALSWLVPGAGFMLAGQRARGLLIFVCVQAPFVVGVALSASVTPPVGAEGDWGSFVVNSLTFATQLGNGGLGLLSLVGSANGWGFLVGTPSHALFELGAFYLLVSGALNYFAVCNFYDRRINPTVLN